jgi:hypothetical protein
MIVIFDGHWQRKLGRSPFPSKMTFVSPLAKRADANGDTNFIVSFSPVIDWKQVPC